MSSKGLNDLFLENNLSKDITTVVYELSNDIKDGKIVSFMSNNKCAVLLKSDFKMLVINLDGTYKCYLKYKDNNNLLYCYSLNKAEFDKLSISQINQNINDYINIWIDSYIK